MDGMLWRLVASLPRLSDGLFAVSLVHHFTPTPSALSRVPLWSFFTEFCHVECHLKLKQSKVAPHKDQTHSGGESPVVLLRSLPTAGKTQDDMSSLADLPLFIVPNGCVTAMASTFL
ncbi:hypothetical protein JDV02_004297 [Purpureocillium takamizusanense]|uniref:Uncharacterized protein n=1 Tax=Purpureocillium takamizusanense TaxID=2060973 RepID=A0A9Q8QEZ7_9HYPO|nr:uncharacterized protein JDV02_004297 [Purpureocillium takamizusanense]UNI17996.1 hypothetical protein JDV02_004297 [Purpureocillium takamizusanense]